MTRAEIDHAIEHKTVLVYFMGTKSISVASLHHAPLVVALHRNDVDRVFVWSLDGGSWSGIPMDRLRTATPEEVLTGEVER